MKQHDLSGLLYATVKGEDVHLIIPAGVADLTAHIVANWGADCQTPMSDDNPFAETHVRYVLPNCDEVREWLTDLGMGGVFETEDTEPTIHVSDADRIEAAIEILNRKIREGHPWDNMQLHTWAGAQLALRRGIQAVEDAARQLHLKRSKKCNRLHLAELMYHLWTMDELLQKADPRPGTEGIKSVDIAAFAGEVDVPVRPVKAEGKEPPDLFAAATADPHACMHLSKGGICPLDPGWVPPCPFNNCFNEGAEMEPLGGFVQDSHRAWARMFRCCACCRGTVVRWSSDGLLRGGLPFEVRGAQRYFLNRLADAGDEAVGLTQAAWNDFVQAALTGRKCQGETIG